MSTTTRTERRNVRIDRAPSARVTAPDRFRTFKSSLDRERWRASLEPVRRLRADGWRMVRVQVDWPNMPMYSRWREETIRELVECYDGCAYAETVGNAGRGSLDIEMVRG